MDFIIQGASAWIILEAIVKVAKAYVKNTNYLTLVNLLGGIAIGLLAFQFGSLEGTLLTAAFQGLTLGLATAGFYEVRKTAGVTV